MIWLLPFVIIWKGLVVQTLTFTPSCECWREGNAIHCGGEGEVDVVLDESGNRMPRPQRTADDLP